MKETLICNLEKHNIYYLSDANCSFYIFVPYKEFNETNLCIRLKSNYQSFDLNRNQLQNVTNELINYYKNIDNYNITLILPVFYDDLLLRIRTINDMEIYQKVDRYLGYMFNAAYNFLIKNNIKVNPNIYVINNDSFRTFTNWFVARYKNRIEYKSIVDLARQSGNFNEYNTLGTPNINFVVSKNESPKLDKTIEIEDATFDDYANDRKKPTELKEVSNAGFVSYVLLGVITFVVSLVLLYMFVK